MSDSWAFAFLAPSIMGALLGQAVDMYASFVPDEVAPSPAAVEQPKQHTVSLQSVRDVGTELAETGLSDANLVEANLRSSSHETGSAFRNIAVTRHQGLVYLAFEQKRLDGNSSTIRVVSSRDEQVWNREFELEAPGTVYGPELLSLGSELFVYVSHEPKGTLAGSGLDVTKRPVVSYAIRKNARGRWSEPVALDLPGHRVSRVRWVSGTALMTAYVGEAGLYRFGDDELEVRMLTSEDGLSWTPPAASDGTVYRGGGSDATFSSNDDGNLMALVRNEAGDRSGWGSSVCIAAAGEWSRWDCVNDPRNYGDATLFTHDSDLYMVGQRQLDGSPDGNGAYDQGHGTSVWRTARNQAAHLTSAKRCALWQYQPRQRHFTFVMDLPTKGDTCSAAVLEGRSPGSFVVYTQTSDPQGPELTLRGALQRPNQLYRFELRMHGHGSIADERPHNQLSSANR